MSVRILWGRRCRLEERPNNLLEARMSAGLSRSKAAEDLKVDPNVFCQ